MNLLTETRGLVEAAIESGITPKEISKGAGVSLRYIGKIRNPNEFKKGEYDSLQKLYDWLIKVVPKREPPKRTKRKKRAA